MTELLPCPFCGGTDIEDDWDDYGNVMQWCKGCDARGPVVGNTSSGPIRKEHTLRDEARRLWNLRGTLHVRFTKSEVAHDIKWPFVLLDQGDKPTP
jgi:Lar family restriction alleviation protein